MATVDWSLKDETPDELNPAQNGFSVDVLVYFECLDEHSIGYFDYNHFAWFFLANQDYQQRPFVWRYFNDENDRISYLKDVQE